MTNNNERTGFFRKIFSKIKVAPPKKIKLIDIVPKKHSTGYKFCDINNDIGDACEVIMRHSPEIRMAYGYARRVAFAACEIQGIAERGGYEHVQNVFKSLQLQTGQSVEFQEQAFSDAVEFIQSYVTWCNRHLAQTLCIIVQEYEVEDGILSDEGLFETVMGFAAEQLNALQPVPISKVEPFRHDNLDQMLANQIRRNHEKGHLDTEHIVSDIAQGVSERIHSAEIAYQFVMEELDAARHGSPMAMRFVLESGFRAHEYKDTLNNVLSQVDGSDGPQQFLIESVAPFMFDMDLMVKLRLDVVKQIIKDWGVQSRSQVAE